MFSVSKIKNIKNTLFILTLFFTNSSIFSSHIIIPQKLSQATNFIVPIATMLTAISINGIQKMKNYSLLGFMIPASITAGTITSWCCDQFTPESNFNAAQDIWRQIDETINKDDLQSILKQSNSINHKHVEYLNTYFNPMLKNIEKANQLIENVESHIDKESFGLLKFKPEFIFKENDHFHNKLGILKSQIGTHKKTISSACDRIKENKAFSRLNKNYIHANSKILDQEKTREQIKILKEQNSYIIRFITMLSNLLKNPFIISSLLNIIGIKIV